MYHPQILKDLDATIRSLLTSYDHHKGLARAHARHTGRGCQCETNERFHAERAADLSERIDGMRRLFNIARDENAREQAETPEDDQ